MKKSSRTGALQPVEHSSEIIKNFPEIQKYMRLDYKMVANVDSSNFNPGHWTQIAKKIQQNYENYDGFVVVQGTDTMTYTASAISFALQNLSKPVVFTGSLIPLEEITSDGRNNLIYACITATLDIAESCIVFGNKILRGNRAKKYRESFVDVFHSPNYPNLGELGRPNTLYDWRKKRRKRKLKFQPEFDSGISLLKLFPGFDPVIIEKGLERGTRGIVIEGFGPGNIPFLERSIIPQIRKAIRSGVPVVMANQMEEGTTNLNAYEAGLAAKKAGAISSGDMTTEATVSKLMWALGKTRNLREIKKIMEKNLAGELKE